MDHHSRVDAQKNISATTYRALALSEKSELVFFSSHFASFSQDEPLINKRSRKHMTALFTFKFIHFLTGASKKHATHTHTSPSTPLSLHFTHCTRTYTIIIITSQFPALLTHSQVSTVWRTISEASKLIPLLLIHAWEAEIAPSVSCFWNAFMEEGESS